MLQYHDSHSCQIHIFVHYMGAAHGRRGVLRLAAVFNVQVLETYGQWQSLIHWSSMRGESVHLPFPYEDGWSICYSPSIRAAFHEDSATLSLFAKLPVVWSSCCEVGGESEATAENLLKTVSYKLDNEIRLR
jgi:hypothetical protein